MGDLNGDGKLDLAVANALSNDVSILQGNGDGTFQTAVNYAAGTNPYSIAVGDFNGDGKLDLAVANLGGNNVSILQGDGTGSFAEPLAQTITALPIVSLSAAPTFPDTLVGQTSSAQDVTLTNSGTVDLSITAVGITGDFAIATNTCTATITAGNDCTVSITFSPTAGGTRNGTLTFTDNAANSPQAIALSGEGADFALTPRTTSLTVASGGYSTFDLLLSPEGGFNQSINLACSGAPQGATCKVTPTSVTLDGTNSVAFGVKVTTTGNAVVGPGPENFVPPSGSLPLAAWLAILGLLALLALARFSPERGRIRRLAPYATLALLVMMWAACGGGSSSMSTTSSSNATPAGTYTLQVNATSGNLSHNTSVTLKVQ